MPSPEFLQPVAPFVHRPIPGIHRAVARRAEREVVQHHVALGLVAVPEHDRDPVRAGGTRIARRTRSLPLSSFMVGSFGSCRQAATSSQQLGNWPLNAVCRDLFPVNRYPMV